jgi:transposase
MYPETTSINQYTANQQHLYMAFELSSSQWLLGFTVGFGQRPRQRSILARDLPALEHEIELAKQRFELPQDTQVVSCYEAGRDGFWLHRYLTSIAVSNQVVDSASIEVNRRAKRAKTDRIDLRKLLTMLMRCQVKFLSLYSKMVHSKLRIFRIFFGKQVIEIISLLIPKANGFLKKTL